LISVWADEGDGARGFAQQRLVRSAQDLAGAKHQGRHTREVCYETPVEIMSISIVSLCDGVSWCERGIDLVAAKALFIAQAPLSVNSLALLAGMVLVIGAEIVVLSYARSSLYRLLHPTKSTRADIVWFLVRFLGVKSVVIAICSLGLTTFSNHLATKYVGFHMLTKIKDPVLQGVVFLIVSDFMLYWVHRGRHAFGWWWEFHKHHHSATELNAITQARFHPLDAAASAISIVIPVQILGGTVGDTLFVLVPLAVHAGLTHSMLPWSWGWFGRYVLYSPIGHRIHHSALPEHKDKNFGALFPIWDWMFGTYYKGDLINEEAGVDDNYQNTHGLIFDLTESVRRAWRSVQLPTALLTHGAVVNKGESR
jgi:sterol desaturase/sphingolipid hydroxylase (fatty acid hydroxylase superfamily)